MHFQNPSETEIRQLLNEVQTIAVVGLSPQPSRPSFRVAQALQSFGYKIIPVRPLVKDVLGDTAYPDLDSLPTRPDLVDVFRAPEFVPAIVDNCLRLGIKKLWLQDGVIDEASALRAQQGGILVVMNRCLWRDYVQLKI